MHGERSHQQDTHRTQEQTQRREHAEESIRVCCNSAVYTIVVKFVIGTGKRRVSGKVDGSEVKHKALVVKFVKRCESSANECVKCGTNYFDNKTPADKCDKFFNDDTQRVGKFMSDVIGVGCDVAEMTLCRGAGWRNLLPSTAPQDESQVSHTGGTKVQAHVTTDTTVYCGF